MAATGENRNEPELEKHRHDDRDILRTANSELALCGTDAASRVGRRRPAHRQSPGRRAPPLGTNLSCFADGAYAGPKLQSALDTSGDWMLEIVKRSEQAKGF